MSGFKRIINVTPLTRVKLKGPQSFTYLVPLNLQGLLRPGQLIEIPFGKKTILGVTSSVEMHRLPSEIKGLKEIKSLTDAGIVFSEQNLRLAQWISKYYVVCLGLVLKSMLPKFSVRSKEPALSGYEKFNPDFVLTEQQRIAVTQIGNYLERPSVFLLKGITGSGKTEVYMQIIKRLIERGKQIIILVPEISLTVQAIERYARRFGIEKIALFHSRMKESEKLWTWQHIKNQNKQIIIGPRSAIFSPVQDLGLIVLDEEHDASFKQFDQNPKYHARDVAQKLSEIWQCPLVLGDATASMETYYKALNHEYTLLELPFRIKADVGLPRVQVVDMKREPPGKNGIVILSEYLKLALLDALKTGKQIILFLNRRGSSTVVICKDCGQNPLCADCATSLVWHTSSPPSPLPGRERDIGREVGGFLLCHHCGRRYDLPATCQNCRGAKFIFWGVGTQMVEEYLNKFLEKNLGKTNLPKVQRMDRDSTEKDGEQQRIYEEWSKGKIKILIGTQIVSKGWDVAKVGLVGIISADTILHLPDFRANERTFQLLTQVAGRAGRGSDVGLAILQTNHPDNYAIENARTHNYEKFYEKEIGFRQEYYYPPFTKLVKLTTSHIISEKALEKMRSVFRQLDASRELAVQIFGPVPAYIFKLRKKYRYHLFLKFSKTLDEESIFNYLKKIPDDVNIDVDPESLL